ncbi:MULTISPECIES: GxxExxY protein [Salegentibacter]|uniref:NADH:ubiquinone oxidoreductase n=1 Tax=Salegentibacter salarius TaxID=435906 RepID=A0A2N0TWB7_9FLAO|nr:MULTISPECIES: GxxExxY protein [Salegentibacter]OEY72701.1 NADH:ubiquinone oxidoreductase [Salegentibacter salarius]PKD19034.1 NADH:ubiquinone oxidoreductase [Salegentibacter salarius]SLK00863.1 GxxExxY protein [Salegentibacter salarius]
MADIIYKDESYAIVGALFNVYNYLGSGFSEIVYKDALELEFSSLNIPFEREKEYSVSYKGIVLSHKFYADFVLFDKIILEIKSIDNIHDKHIAQCINYLKVSENRLAILANFHKDLLDHKRIVL